MSRRASRSGTPPPRAGRGVASENERRYLDLLEHLPVGVYRTTSSGRIIEANRALARILGCRRRDELKQLNVKRLYVHRRSRREHLRQLAAAATAFNEFQLRTRDNRLIWVRDYPRAVKGADGRVLHYDGILVDVSERKRIEQELQRSEQDYRQLFEHAHDAIIVFAVRGEVILDVNHRACELYGFHRRELIGMSLRQLSQDIPLGEARIRRTLAQRSLRNFETVHRRKDGGLMRLEVNAALVHYRGQQAILSIHRDVSRRRLLEESIRQMAFQDSLTGLPNRALLADRLAQALVAARRGKSRVTLLYIDLDGFKEVNDHCGHDTGDQLLRLVAARIAGQLRRSDTVARLGGDEFLVLLPDAGRVRDGQRIARKILAAVRRPCLIGRRRLQVTGSIGIAIYPQDGRSADMLLRRADRAMYVAKAMGRDACTLASHSRRG